MKNRGPQVAVTEEEKQRIKELFQVLGSQIRVAEAVGRSEYAVHCVLKGVPKINRKRESSDEFFDWKDYQFQNVIV